MKLTTKQDIEAPVAAVWAALTDYPSWERAAMRRGAEVTREGQGREIGPGTTWTARFTLRGQARVVTVRLATVDPQNRLVLTGTSRLFSGEFVVEVVQMSARRTRVHVSTEVSPLTLSARLILQSLKLAKTRVTRRYEKGVAQAVSEIGKRLAAAPRS